MAQIFIMFDSSNANEMTKDQIKEILIQKDWITNVYVASSEDSDQSDLQGIADVLNSSLE